MLQNQLRSCERPGKFSAAGAFTDRTVLAAPTQQQDNA
jgi:hypothetical protein